MYRKIKVVLQNFPIPYTVFIFHVNILHWFDTFVKIRESLLMHYD